MAVPPVPVVGLDRAVFMERPGDKPRPDLGLGPGVGVTLDVAMGVLTLLMGVGTYGVRTGSDSSAPAYTNPLNGLLLGVTNGPDRAKELI